DLKITYIETTIQAEPVQREALIALWADLGYEAFEEVEDQLRGYIPVDQFDTQRVAETSQLLGLTLPKHREILPENWNAKWEAEYPSVYVDDFCQIVPTFREAKEGFRYTLQIDPKMAFGTGHHETTRLVIRHMSALDVRGLQVLDMGCGTGVLGILARKMGAAQVTAIDIDPWSEENTLENVQINQVDQVEILLGGKEVIPPVTFDMILANINRNVLLEDIPSYALHLQTGGKLVISGFYTEDESLLERKALESDLQLSKRWEENNWVSLLLVKS
ncbi:MAG: 50S ribosomal protein L11 methyltransferase, partial [Bacteroidota bacterium]